MLVLSRKEGESVMIGENISITILSIEPGGQVNIGISAPRTSSSFAASCKRRSAKTRRPQAPLPRPWWISCAPP